MSNLVFEKLTQTLAASETWRLRIVADYFRLSASNYPVNVRLFRDNRELGAMANFQAGDYVAGVAFDQIAIENGSTAQSVTAQLAGGGVGSDRVLGEVSVISGEVSRSEAGVSYGGYGEQPAVAANYPHVQLWNPLGSGKNLIVNEVAASSGNGGQLFLASHNAAIGSLAAYQASAKKFGGSASVAQLRNGALAAFVGTYLFGAWWGPNALYTVALTEPYVIPPGQGLLALNSVVNTTVMCGFQYYEKAV